MRKLSIALLGALAWAGMSIPLLAQVNVVPQVGQINSIIRNPTYTATSVGLVPVSSATDIFCIAPGTSRNISIRRVTISGTAGTAITTPFLLYKRATRGTSGTSPSGLDLPVAVPLNPSDQASTAVVTSYTANPTVAASPILMGSMLVDLPVTTAAGGVTESVRTWGTSVDMFSRGLDLLKNTTTQICVNVNGVTVASGILTINMEWQETN